MKSNINNLKIYPTILAGGSGTRLWPLSRKSYPKQFSNIIGEKTLFQQSALRTLSSDIIKFAPHIILTNSDFRFIIREQLQNIGVNPSHILIEPESKNTAPAILAASLFAHSQDPEAIVLVAPSDHIISNNEDFHSTVLTGLAQVQKGKIVTFGITPKNPETGYGYIELSQDNLDCFGTSSVVSFVEKPNLALAKIMFDSRKFLWNAGIFLFKAKDMLEAFSAFAPHFIKFTSEAVDTAIMDLGFLRFNPDPWQKLESISIDYAIMEKAKNLVAVPYKSHWSDLGNWRSVWNETTKDDRENAISEGAHVIDCFGSMLRTDSATQQIVGLGLENIIAIAMPDAVLVAHKNKEQDVKQAVKLLKQKKIPQAETFPIDYRPWGWFESLAIGDKFQVKRIIINPKASLSLQSHKYRSEHWIIVEGKAKVTIEGNESILNTGQSVYVPLGAIHRVENPGKTLTVLIEVQIGSYLGEDDIIRYEDIYSRS